jgi:hypothetical protein
MFTARERSQYLLELKAAVNARSVWLFRNFLVQWGPKLGPLKTILENRCDDAILDFMDEISAAIRAESDHQLACQFVAPWSMPRSEH